jgi:tRNA-dihydrouridine synthase B
VLQATGADAILIGRAAQGRPWLFREISHYLTTGEHLPAPEVAEIHDVLLAHLDELYRFYGDLSGSRMARKHIAWYTRGLADSAQFRHAMNQLEGPQAQLEAVNDFFWRTRERSNRLVYLDADMPRLAAA